MNNPRPNLNTHRRTLPVVPRDVAHKLDAAAIITGKSCFEILVELIGEHYESLTKEHKKCS